MIDALTYQFMPRVLPTQWRQVPTPEVSRGSVTYQNHSNLLAVLLSAEKAPGTHEVWLHVSVSHRDRIPTWEELRDVKDLFVGRDKLALQVLPSADEYVNICWRVLHLWHCPDRRPVPDFRNEAGAI